MIPVVWHEGSLDLYDNRSHYALSTLINETFDNSDLQFLHCNTWKQLPEKSTGAIVIVHGGHQRKQLEEVLRDLQTLRWSLVMVMCDDESAFPTRKLLGPNRKIWQQMPIPRVHSFADRLMICGYPKDCQEELGKFPTSLMVEKPLNWFFAGQVNHVRRYQCVRALSNIDRGVLVETKSFFEQGLDRYTYYFGLARAKFAPCPSGPVTPDTIRMAEALEAGCIPIVDECPGLTSGYPQEYFKNVFGEYPPFPIIKDWSTLPQIIDKELRDWPQNQIRVQKWWKEYKTKMGIWLKEDIGHLQRSFG